MKRKPTRPAIYLLLFILWLEGCKSVNPDLEPNKQQTNYGRYIVTDKTDIGTPLYTNRVRGAGHMMRSSDGYYYSYDGDAGNSGQFEDQQILYPGKGLVKEVKLILRAHGEKEIFGCRR